MCCERAGRLAALLILATLAGLLASPVRAQDDGPRVYQLAPLGTKTLTAFAVAKRGNEAPDEDVSPGSDIDTNIVVLRYAQTFSLGGRQLNPFVILPVGEVRSTVRTPSTFRTVLSTSSIALCIARTLVPSGAVIETVNSASSTSEGTNSRPTRSSTGIVESDTRIATTITTISSFVRRSPASSA